MSRGASPSHLGTTPPLWPAGPTVSVGSVGELLKDSNPVVAGEETAEDDFGSSAQPHSGLPPARIVPVGGKAPDFPNAESLLGISVAAVLEGTARLGPGWQQADVRALFEQVLARGLDPLAFFEEEILPNLTADSLSPGALCQLACRVDLASRGQPDAKRRELRRALEALGHPDVGSERQASRWEVECSSQQSEDYHFIPEPPLDLEAAGLSQYFTRIDVRTAPPDRVFNLMRLRTQNRLSAPATLELAFRLGTLTLGHPDREAMRERLRKSHGAATSNRRRPSFAQMDRAFAEGGHIGNAERREPLPERPAVRSPRPPRDLTAIRAYFERNGLAYLEEHRFSPDLPPMFDELRRYDAERWEGGPREKAPTYRRLCAKMNSHLESLSEAAAHRFILEQLEAGLSARVSIRWVSKRVGYGLFADEDLPAGTVIGEYLGEVNQLAEDSPERDRNAYLFSTPLFEDPAHLTAFRKELVIDSERAGNETSLINESKDDPNLDKATVFRNGFWRIVLLTKRPTFAGEEFRFDYGPRYGKQGLKASRSRWTGAEQDRGPGSPRAG